MSKVLEQREPPWPDEFESVFREHCEGPQVEQDLELMMRPHVVSLRVEKGCLRRVGLDHFEFAELCAETLESRAFGRLRHDE